MSSTMHLALRKAVSALEAVPHEGAVLRSVRDAELLEWARIAADLQRLAGARMAAIAGELSRRSAPDLGGKGLARRSGHRTVEELVRVTTGATAREASTAVRVGDLIASAGAGEALMPWLESVGHAAGAGTLSVSAADAIRVGLGEPAEGAPADVLAAAAERLVAEAAMLDADRLQRRARELRDELDEAGIADRERRLRDSRSLKAFALPDGRGRIVWTLDPESWAIASEVRDRVLSPRIGGPRFVDPDTAEMAGRITDDPRTNEQIASDVFLELLRVGAEVQPDRLLGTGAPAVRVLVTETALRARTGHGHIEGSDVPISIETVERVACAHGVQSVVFDETGAGLDLGREQRLYSSRQRRVMAARDGGCRWNGCERPPSWCEAHHIEFWKDGGRTDVDDGLLLCRHHHLLLHNDKWSIERQGSEYWLTPPEEVDPTQTARLMSSKSAALHDLLASA
jgi:hypothetical protein